MKKLYRYVVTFFQVLLKNDYVTFDPVHLQIEPTTHCNMHCKMCIRETRKIKAKHLSISAFRKIVNHIKPLKINLTGNGESTLNNDLFEMIRFCRENNIYVYLNTNLLMSNLKLKKLVNSCPNLIKISIDASNANSYEKIRQNQSFDKVINNFELLGRLCDQDYGRDTFVRVNTVLMPENEEELPAITKIAKANNADVVVFKQLCFYGDIEADRNYYKRYCYEHRATIINAIKEIEKIGMKNNLQDLADEIEFISKGGYGNATCIMPWVSSYICSNGNVVPCCYLVSESFEDAEGSALMGNVFEQSWHSIWNGERYIRVRRLMKSGNRPFKACQTCYPPSLNIMMSRMKKISKILPSFF